MSKNSNQQNLSLEGYDTVETTGDFRTESFTAQVKSVSVVEHPGKKTDINTYVSIEFTDGGPAIELLIMTDRKTGVYYPIKQMPGFTDLAKFVNSARRFGVEVMFPKDNSYNGVMFAVRQENDLVPISLNGAMMSWQLVLKEQAGTVLDHESGTEGEKKQFRNWLLTDLKLPTGAPAPASTPAKAPDKAAPAPAAAAQTGTPEVTIDMVKDRIVAVMGTDTTVQKSFKSIRNAISDALLKEGTSNAVRVAYLNLSADAAAKLVDIGYLEKDGEMYRLTA